VTSTTDDAAVRAEVLRRLHSGPEPLVLPNAWDPPSARVVARAGFGAVATSSAAVGEVLGYADHEQTPPAEMLDAVARVAAAVDVPVTADLEAGYGLEAADLARRVLATGAVGLNLEDTDHAAGALADPEQHAGYLARVKEAAREEGVDLVLNARVDVFLHAQGDPADVLDEALARARAYVEAGADCVYPILLTDEDVLSAFVTQARAMGAPVNALLTRGSPSLTQLAGLGVRRVSLGPGLWRSALAYSGALAEALAAGDSSAFTG